MKRETGIILALDVTDPEIAIDIAKDVEEYIDAIKVNYPLVLSSGLQVVRLLSTIRPVICDFKVADIPNTTRLIVKRVKDIGAAGIIIHGFVGVESMKEAIKTAGDMDVYVVSEMSHPGAEVFFEPVSESIIKTAAELGATGLIAPATRPERIRYIRDIAGKDMKILSPGVGAQGGSGKRAIEAGADYIIVGRSIYEAENPKKAAELLYCSLQ